MKLDAKFLFLAPPSLESLESRLRGRGTDKEEVIRKRLDAAGGELKNSKEPGLYDDFLVNDNVDKCYAEFARVISAEINQCRQVKE